MPVISLVSSKGGAGKTTTALLIAGAIADAGKRVALIDSDPNRPLERWARLPGKPAEIEVAVDCSAATLAATIESAAARADWVLVDLEGRATERAAVAIAASDFTLIPCQPSMLDAVEAAKVVRLIRTTEGGAPSPFSLIFTRVNAALRDKTHRALERALAEQKVPLFQTAVIERAALKAVTNRGGTVFTLPADAAAGLDKAQANAQAVAQELIDALRAAKALAHV